MGSKPSSSKKYKSNCWNTLIENIVNLTGFKFDVDDKVTNMTFPNKTRIDILRNKISYMVSEFYPEFADRVWGV